MDWSILEWNRGGEEGRKEGAGKKVKERGKDHEGRKVRRGQRRAHRGRGFALQLASSGRKEGRKEAMKVREGK